MNSKTTICFVFFGAELALEEAVRELVKSFPDSTIVGCSGAGEIIGDKLHDEKIIVTIVQFENSHFESFQTQISDAKDSFSAGEALAKMFSPTDLKAVYILSEGLLVNGTELMNGLKKVLPQDISISGGLAGDGTRFISTRTLFGDQCRSGQIIGIGFYGSNISVVSRSRGGWMPFGPERTVTQSVGNVVHSIDDSPALTLYKGFLGKSAENLPSSALNFPLFIQGESQAVESGVVRTVLNVDEETQTMTFAGDIPTGRTVRLMRSTHKSLVEAAGQCADDCKQSISGHEPVLSLIVSCVGRRLVMGEVTDDEIETVYRALPEGSTQTGFYSYGELAPNGLGACDLHNQTMTVTWISEK